MDARRSCLIATTPRSGSWLLADALHSTGLVGPPDEYFRPETIEDYNILWGIAKDAPVAERIATAIQHGTADNGVFGAKLHWYQWAHLLRSLREAAPENASERPAELIARYLPDPRYVFLIRRDTARQAISHYRAIESGVWNRRADEKRRTVSLEDHQPDFTRVKASEKAFLRHTDLWATFFLRNDVPLQEVTYEDFVADFTDTVAEVLRFLGLRPPRNLASLQPNLIQQADDLSERWLQEYLAVRDTIAPHPHPGEFYERSVANRVKVAELLQP